MFLYGFELHRLLIIKNLILNLINWFCYSTYVSRRICIDPLKIGDISCYSTYVSRRISIDPLIIGDNCSFQWKTWRLVKWRRNDITSSGTKFKIVSRNFFPSNVVAVTHFRSPLAVTLTNFDKCRRFLTFLDVSRRFSTVASLRLMSKLPTVSHQNFPKLNISQHFDASHNVQVRNFQNS